MDYRQLNKKTVPKRFPIPHPEDLIEKVKNGRVFSVIDLKAAYYHMDACCQKPRGNTQL